MDTVMSAREFACWNFKTDKPSVNQVNSKPKMCREKTIKNAEKVGNREWHINCTKEWPLLFPPEEPPMQVDAATALGELLIAVGKLMKEGAKDEHEKSGAA